MVKQRKDVDGDSGRGLLWLFGAVLVIQGFGSAVTEAGWETSFGVAALLRAADLPEWSTLVIGFAGLVLWGAAARGHYGRKRAARRA
ncbi:hypothetical protein ABZ252_09095 [Streptomyces sp. NPDC006175]|uniref:hypothetical protein n=1 Tax=unclassified Streptomyces TaxID=2593676 RepID=UPI0033B9F94F